MLKHKKTLLLSSVVGLAGLVVAPRSQAHNCHAHRHHSHHYRHHLSAINLHGPPGGS